MPPENEDPENPDANRENGPSKSSESQRIGEAKILSISGCKG
jgi:hypothetical protein